MQAVAHLCSNVARR